MTRLLLLLALAACESVYTDPGGASDAASDAAEPVEGQFVFTTSTRYRGGLLGGVEGADAICATHAEQAGLPGEYKAWLSQLDTNAADRLTHATRPYVLVGGIPIANTWDELVSFGLVHAIDRDERGDAVVAQGAFPTAVWTATRFDGTAFPWSPGGDTTSNPRLECGKWATFDAGVGMVGFFDAVGNQWTQSSLGVGCDELLPLYCFQQ